MVLWLFRRRGVGAIDSDDENPRLREKARRAPNSWLGRLESLIEEGQGRGEIRCDVEPSELVGLP